MDESDLHFWKSIAIKMTNQVEKAISPLIGRKEAGEIIRMGADGTPSKLIDLVAEDEVIEVLISSKRPVTLISEEIGTIKINSSPNEYIDIEALRSVQGKNLRNSEDFYNSSKDPQIIFVVDPLDGTSNAVKKIPAFGISIAIAEYTPKKDLPSLNDVEMGFIKNFATGDFYEVIKDNESLVNGKKVSPSIQTSLNHSSMGAFIYGTKFSQINNICKIIRRMRILGSVALELSYVGNGAYDAFMDLRGNLRVVDIAAAKLFVEQSGGLITDQTGLPLNGLLNLSSRTSIIAAGNKDLHQEIMKIMEVI
ncbi:MAG: inositol monophosphatase family protein [Methanobacteriaceae archaeon]|nr:inositol monophosphatase family protein [Methanobacteriaceae archaeon]